MDEKVSRYFKHVRDRLRPTSRKEDTRIRTDFQRDFDRILFSSHFRALQNKTQVLPLPESDFVHNRLTHSLEASSVGRSLGVMAGNAVLRKYPFLKEEGFTEYDFGFMVSSAALAHDIGNPPFGHAGEEAISSYFKDGGGDRFFRNLDESQAQDLKDFEGNSAGFRLLVSSLKTVTTIPAGLNLTLGTLGSFVKYPKESLPVAGSKSKASLKKYGFFQSEKQIFKNLADFLSLQVNENPEGILAWKRFPLAFLVEAADDICYHIMDFEDGYNIGYIDYRQIYDLFTGLLENNGNDFKQHLDRIVQKKEKIAFLRSMVVHTLIMKISAVFNENIDKIFAGELDKSLMSLLDEGTKEMLNGIMKLSVEHVYRSPTVLKIEAAGYKVLPDLLDKFILGIFESDKYRRYYRLIPEEYKDKSFGDYEKILNITMWISGMTDRYAMELFRNLNGIELPNY